MNSTIYLVVTTLLGIFAILLFSIDHYLPLALSVCIYLFALIVFQVNYKRKRIGILALLLIFTYLLPFIHIPPYLWYDFNNSEPILLWGLAVRPYMLKEEIIELTATIGAVGALGLVSAVLLCSNKRAQTNVSCYPIKTKTLSLPLWISWYAFGLFFSIISSPSETIFESEYASVESLSDNLNFGSSWTISYIALTFLYCDALNESIKRKKTIKVMFSTISLVYIVVWLQLFRGDRAALPWVLSLFFLYFYWNPIGKTTPSFRSIKLKIGFLLISLIAISAVVGVVRHSTVGLDIASAAEVAVEFFASEQVDISTAFHGTWSAVLLTPLSVAGDNINNLLPLKLGKDYSDLILSLPPGPVADALGYIRPISSTSGPAWEMRYGLGGTHASVVPFMNFRLIGVYLASLLIGYIYISIEKRVYHSPTIINLSLIVTTGLITPHFLWYGEKYFINSLIIWFILSFTYKIFVSKAPRPIFSPHSTRHYSTININ